MRKKWDGAAALCKQTNDELYPATMIMLGLHIHMARHQGVCLAVPMVVDGAFAAADADAVVAACGGNVTADNGDVAADCRRVALASEGHRIS